MGSLVFGPVPSRRLGRSLGVDLVPFKTCSYDCVYCQLGRTTRKTAERREWVPLEKVLEGIRAKLETSPDYITLSGSGEPTLYSRLGELIGGIKRLTETPVAVLTNGSLLFLPEVRESLLGADLVLPSLDAGDEKAFLAVNRPCEEISFDAMAEGLVEFRREFKGAFWLEVFLVGGVTDTDEQVEKLASLVRRIGPERVQLNTVTRPPAESGTRAVARERMERIAEAFEPTAEVVADWRGTHEQPAFSALRSDVLDLLKRRPCTVSDIAEGLGIHRNEVVKYVEELASRGMIEAEKTDRGIYWRAARREGEEK